MGKWEKAEKERKGKKKMKQWENKKIWKECEHVVIDNTDLGDKIAKNLQQPVLAGRHRLN